MDTAYLALGMMSGTSLDGVDAALLETDGSRILSTGEALTLAYPEHFRKTLALATQGKADDILRVEQELTEYHARAARSLLLKAGLSASDIEVIGFHGQTVAHRPAEGLTWQIGNGALLAEQTGIPVICDFRRRDVAAGGQGAPLVPVFHSALAQDLPHPLAIINIGGIANVTYIPEAGNLNGIIAFDTGPGNALLNQWMEQHTGEAMDAGGEAGLKGKVDKATLTRLLAKAFFRHAPPKSLDRYDFTLEEVERLTVENGAATLAALTAHSIAQSAEHLPKKPKQWLITGGGRHNACIMNMLSELLGKTKVKPVNAVGWNGDALEAQAFAFLAVRSLLGLPLTLPGTTGCAFPVSGGALYRV